MTGSRRRGLGPAGPAVLDATQVPLAQGRGLDALLAVQQRTAVEQPAQHTQHTQQGQSGRGMTASAARVAARMVEADWLVVTTTTGDDTTAHADLHHATLAPALLTSLAVHGLAAQLNAAGAVLVASCGLVPDVAARPGEVHRRASRRCPGCCVAVGCPGGVGSPVLDAGCQVWVEQRLGGLV